MIKVTQLVKHFAGEKNSNVHAVNGISFDVPEGRFFTLLGPSGCGKTTTLRCIAGLERADGGVIFIGDRVVSSVRDRIFVPPNGRDIGMVFQSYAIWPHMTVYENVAFPLRVGKAKLSEQQVSDKVRKALATVQLEGLEARPAPRLSGGQQQRLALARALVREPKVLLLDEPLSNLDAKLREQMRVEIRELQRRLGITTVYVTHDQSEALAMSNLIAVMKDGNIIQMGHPADIYASPTNRFVADFIGSTNFLRGTVRSVSVDSKFGEVETMYGSFACNIPPGLRSGDAALISVRPENVQLSAIKPNGTNNILEGQVQVSIFLGEMFDCQVAVRDQILRVRLHPSQRVHRGDKVYLHLPSESITVMQAS